MYPELQDKLLSAEEGEKVHVLVASQPIEVRLRNPIPGDKNHATINSYQHGVANVAERVQLLLIGQMIGNPVYDTLRTKKQLGYVVFGAVDEQINVLELRVLVQGEKEQPDEVDRDIEARLRTTKRRWSRRRPCSQPSPRPKQS